MRGAFVCFSFSLLFKLQTLRLHVIMFTRKRRVIMTRNRSAKSMVDFKKIKMHDAIFFKFKIGLQMLGRDKYILTTLVL